MTPRAHVEREGRHARRQDGFARLVLARYFVVISCPYQRANPVSYTNEFVCARGARMLGDGGVALVDVRACVLAYVRACVWGFKNQVIPVLEGVAIIAQDAGGKEIARAETGKDGTYSIGPLADEAYVLRAEKTNFQFKKEGSDFRSVQVRAVREGVGV